VVKERRGMESLAVLGFAIPLYFRCTGVIMTLDSRIIIQILSVKVSRHCILLVLS
jgi:hypothetical protein